MESQPQNTEFCNNYENFHPMDFWNYLWKENPILQLAKSKQINIFRQFWKGENPIL